MRYHVEDDEGKNLCGSPGESHSTAEAIGADDFWCSMCARLYNGVSE